MEMCTWVGVIKRAQGNVNLSGRDKESAGKVEPVRQPSWIKDNKCLLSIIQKKVQNHDTSIRGFIFSPNIVTGFMNKNSFSKVPFFNYTFMTIMIKILTPRIQIRILSQSTDPNQDPNLNCDKYINKPLTQTD